MAQANEPREEYIRSMCHRLTASQPVLVSRRSVRNVFEIPGETFEGLQLPRSDNLTRASARAVLQYSVNECRRAARLYSVLILV